MDGDFRNDESPSSSKQMLMQKNILIITVVLVASLIFVVSISGYFYYYNYYYYYPRPFVGSNHHLLHSHQSPPPFNFTGNEVNSAFGPAPPPDDDVAEETRNDFPSSAVAGGAYMASASISIAKKQNSKLEKLEVGIAQARAAIRGAAQDGGKIQDDPDYIPNGPIYWNPKVFQRSYLEMEKQFKVYIYEEGDPPIFHTAPSSGVLGMEGIFINEMEISRFRTRDPDKAHVYFLPFSIISIVNYVYVVDSRDWNRMKNTAADYVNVIADKYPYWNRSFGADHFMLACHDWGPEISKSVPLLYNASIRALCNANTSEEFNPANDVSIPEIYLPSGTTNGLLGGPSPSSRPIFAFFAGGIHGYIRTVLFENWENKDDAIQIHQYLPKGTSYYEMLQKSKYCICPSGYEVADARIFEALYTGCVPVVIKDHYVAPFSDVLNWKTFSVDISINDISNLKKILMSIPSRQYIKMHRRGLQVRKHFEITAEECSHRLLQLILGTIDGKQDQEMDFDASNIELYSFSLPTKNSWGRPGLWTSTHQ